MAINLESSLLKIKQKAKRRPVLLLMKTVTELRVLHSRTKTQRGSKEQNPVFCSRCRYCQGLHEARCDFLDTANEKGLVFTGWADLLTAGVSRIQFQASFFSPPSVALPLPHPLPCTLPSWRYRSQLIQVLISLWIIGWSRVQLSFFSALFKESCCLRNKSPDYMGTCPGSRLLLSPRCITLA